jgi:RNA-directed DNA polymerase
MFDKHGAVDGDMLRNISHDVSSNDGIRASTFEELQRLTIQRQKRSLEETKNLMERVCHKDNLMQACKRVVANKGAHGIDGMKVEQLKEWLFLNEDKLRYNLLNGLHRPSPVRRVEIPKPGGGIRQLGIPTVIDRLVQQALLQSLSPIFESYFSESNFGFRPGRSAHQAIIQAKEYVQEGRWWVVDIDLEKFFDRVNHDILMSRVARKIGDKRVLFLIRKYLQAGILVDGVRVLGDEGTPQGGPLSPLLANILLDDLDKELERRGHKFCRYADDCNIYVLSERAGERVMKSVTEFLEGKLKLKVNRDKSAVAPSSYSEISGLSDWWQDRTEYSGPEHKAA